MLFQVILNTKKSMVYQFNQKMKPPKKNKKKKKKKKQKTKTKKKTKMIIKSNKKQ